MYLSDVGKDGLQSAIAGVGNKVLQSQDQEICCASLCA